MVSFSHHTSVRTYNLHKNLICANVCIKKINTSKKYWCGCNAAGAKAILDNCQCAASDHTPGNEDDRCILISFVVKQPAHIFVIENLWGTQYFLDGVYVMGILCCDDRIFCIYWRCLIRIDVTRYYDMPRCLLAKTTLNTKLVKIYERFMIGCAFTVLLVGNCVCG